MRSLRDYGTCRIAFSMFVLPGAGCFIAVGLTPICTFICANVVRCARSRRLAGKQHQQYTSRAGQASSVEFEVLGAAFAVSFAHRHTGLSVVRPLRLSRRMHETPHTARAETRPPAADLSLTRVTHAHSVNCSAARCHGSPPTDSAPATWSYNGFDVDSMTACNALAHKVIAWAPAKDSVQVVPKGPCHPLSLCGLGQALRQSGQHVASPDMPSSEHRTLKPP